MTALAVWLAALSADPVGECWSDVSAYATVHVCNKSDGTAEVCVWTDHGSRCWIEDRTITKRWPQ